MAKKGQKRKKAKSEAIPRKESFIPVQPHGVSGIFVSDDAHKHIKQFLGQKGVLVVVDATWWDRNTNSMSIIYASNSTKGYRTVVNTDGYEIATDNRVCYIGVDDNGLLRVGVREGERTGGVPRIVKSTPKRGRQYIPYHKA